MGAFRPVFLVLTALLLLSGSGDAQSTKANEAVVSRDSRGGTGEVKSRGDDTTGDADDTSPAQGSVENRGGSSSSTTGVATGEVTDTRPSQTTATTTAVGTGSATRDSTTGSATGVGTGAAARDSTGGDSTGGEVLATGEVNGRPAATETTNEEPQEVNNGAEVGDRDPIVVADDSGPSVNNGAEVGDRGSGGGDTTTGNTDAVDRTNGGADTTGNSDAVDRTNGRDDTTGNADGVDRANGDDTDTGNADAVDRTNGAENNADAVDRDNGAENNADGVDRDGENNADAVDRDGENNADAVDRDGENNADGVDRDGENNADDVDRDGEKNADGVDRDGENNADAVDKAVGDDNNQDGVDKSNKVGDLEPLTADNADIVKLADADRSGTPSDEPGADKSAAENKPDAADKDGENNADGVDKTDGDDNNQDGINKSNKVNDLEPLTADNADIVKLADADRLGTTSDEPGADKLAGENKPDAADKDGENNADGDDTTDGDDNNQDGINKSNKVNDLEPLTADNADIVKLADVNRLSTTSDEPGEPASLARGSKESGSAHGDPHVKTWSGEHYEYHGACDLVLVHVPGFGNGKGLDVHIRNKRMRGRFSFIETAVLRIGDETLEVKGGDGNPYWINGVKGKPRVTGLLDQSISGYPIKFKITSKKLRKFVIDLGDGEQVIIKVFKFLVRVDFVVKNKESFGSAVGLMGTWPEGKKVARDLTTELTDYDAFGSEWQVIASEPALFHERGDVPHAPQKCEMPVQTTSRRLAESKITLEEAEEACVHVDEAERMDCIYDVLAAEDMDLAGAY